MEKPTPALPKGGGIMFFCPSVRNKGVGFYLPSLGEGSGVGVSPPPFGRGWEGVLCSFVLLSDIKWGILSFCFSVRAGVGFYLPSLGVIDEVASLVEE